jgi:hypothetical protein
LTVKSSTQIDLEAAAELYDRLAGLLVVAVGAVGRDLDLLPVDHRADRAEVAADVPGALGQRSEHNQNLVGRRVRGEVEIFRGPAEKGVANRTADEGEFEACRLEGGGKRSNGRAFAEFAQSNHGFLNRSLHSDSLDSAVHAVLFERRRRRASPASQPGRPRIETRSHRPAASPAL